MIYKSLVAPIHENCEILQEAVEATLDKAEEIYGNAFVEHCGTLDLQFYEKGRNAGIAAIRRLEYSGEIVGLLQFSMELVKRNLQQMIEEIVPHEVSHILCMANTLEYSHGPIWETMCRSLGGTGQAKHTMSTSDGRLKRLYEASNPYGGSIWLTIVQYKTACAGAYCVKDCCGHSFTLTKSSLTGKMIKL
jgi:predicted SprT family Zn-dependent metalloprotease